jgi:hypothetical protein
MQIKKNRVRLIIYLSISTLLILSSINSFGISTSVLENNKIQNKNLVNRVTLNNLKIESKSVNLADFLLKDNKLHASSKNNLNNIIVSNAPDNESYPSMDMKGNIGLIAYEYENERETFVHLRYSLNYGKYWSVVTKIKAILDNYPIEIDSPSLSIIPYSNVSYGVYTSPIKNRGVFGYFEIIDIEKPNIYSSYTLDWTGFPDPGGDPSITFSFWDFDTPKIITYKNESTPWVIFLTGSTNYSYDKLIECNDSIMTCFNDPYYPEYFITLCWFPEFEYCNNLSISRYYNSSLIYGVCEIKNGSKQDLLIFEGNPRSWYNGDDLKNQTISSNINLSHPNIHVTENKIFIVADSEKNGIVLYKKDIASTKWICTNVTNGIISPGKNPNYPMVFSKNNCLFCTFIESNNIYLTSSNDNGQNWSNPLQLNSEIGSVVEKYRFGDLIDDYHILWTDNRDGNNDIYLGLLNEPPETPDIIGPSNGFSNITYDFMINSIDLDNDNISYFINWGDNTSEWTDFYPSNNNVTIKHAWKEKGTYIIKAKAKDYYGFESNWSTFKIDINKPEIQVSIKRGFRRSIQVCIENIGSCNINNLTWNITILRRGIIKRPIFKLTGNSSSFEIGSKEIIFNRPFGFGFIKVTVNVTAPGMKSFEKTIKGFIFLRFIRLRRFL